MLSTPFCQLSLMAQEEVGQDEVGKIPVNEMTSRDYYFDSYAHFGIHEVAFSGIFVNGHV